MLGMMALEIHNIGPSSIKIYKIEPTPVALLYQINEKFISYIARIKMQQLKMISDRVIDDHFTFINGGIRILAKWE